MKPENLAALFLSISICTAVLLSFLASSGPIQWMDGGRFLAQASHGDIFLRQVGSTIHPLYHAMNRTLSIATNQDVVSLFNSILLVPLGFVTYQLSKLLGGTKTTALSIVATVLWSHGIFWVSTKVEVYILSSLLIALCYLYFFLYMNQLTWRNTMMIGMLFGLAVTTHQLALIACLPVLAYLLRYASSSLVIVGIGVLIGSFATWKGLYYHLASGKPLLDYVNVFFVDGSISSKTTFASRIFRIDRVMESWRYVMPIALSFLGYQALGFVALLRGNTRIRILALSAMSVLLFSITYDVNDRFTFCLPAVVFFAICGGIYLQDCRRFTLVTTFNCLIGPILITVVYLSDLGLPTPDPAPFRNSLKYYLMPYLKDDSAEQFVQYLERSHRHYKTILADRTTYNALISAQACGLLEDAKAIRLPCFKCIGKHHCTCFLWKDDPMPNDAVIVRKTSETTYDPVKDGHRKYLIEVLP